MYSGISFQGSITTTGTAQQLPANAVNTNVTISAPSANAASIEIGFSNGVTSSNAYSLAAGDSVTIWIPLGNTNQIWVVGTQNDKYSVIGT